jgi:hypothetical protein
MNQSYQNYLLSDHWTKLKGERKRMDGDRCLNCGNWRGLTGHHLIYRRLYDCTLEDVMTLCGACHNAIHRHMKKHKIRHGVLSREDVLGVLESVEWKSNDWGVKPVVVDGPISEADRIELLTTDAYAIMCVVLHRKPEMMTTWRWIRNQFRNGPDVASSALQELKSFGLAKHVSLKDPETGEEKSFWVFTTTRGDFSQHAAFMSLPVAPAGSSR